MTRTMRTMGVTGCLVLSLAVSSSARADDKAACADAYGKAQHLRGANKLVSAREQLRVCAQASCTKFIAKDCASWLVDVESRIPSIVLFAKDAGGQEISDVTVSMDGNSIADRLDGHAIEVDGGQHTFTFTFADGKKVDQSYVVLEGQKAQRVGASAPQAPAVSATPGAASGGDIFGPPATKDTAGTSRWTGRKTLALVAGGAGLAGIGLGAVFGLKAMSSASAQDKDCHSSAPGDCINPTQAQTDHNDASSASTISTIGFIAGGALVAAGAVLFFTAPRGDGNGDGTQSAWLQLAPSVAPGSAGMQLRGRF